VTLRTLALLAPLVFATAVARAAPIDEAKAAFQAGKLAFERGEYDKALAEFNKANAIAPAPTLQYNIGKTYEALGRYREAADAFEKYFELYGPPQNDEDKQFQDSLRARIASDRARTSSSPPPQQLPPQPPPPRQPPSYPPNTQYGQQYPQYPNNQYYYQQPYQYYPYQQQGLAPTTYKVTKADLVLEARGRRNRAIALIVVGVVLDVIGIVLFADAVAHDYGVGNLWVNYTEGFFGASAFIVGITLWAPGAASFNRASRRLRELDMVPDGAIAPNQSFTKAVMFNGPTIRF
jgi:tetratricopeptide (TPR) repeat protein